MAAAALSLLVGVALEHNFAGGPAELRPGSFAHARLLSLPLAAQGPVSAALGSDSPAYRVTATSDALEATNPSQRLHSIFSRSGVLVSSGTTEVGLSLRGVGDGSSLQPLRTASPTVNTNRVSYQRAGLTEWYANGPLGLEQGFTVSRAAAGDGSGPLTLSMALSGNARASLEPGGRSVTLSHAGGPALRYGGLVASDATGRLLHGWLALQSGRLLIRVNANGARFPLRIDPFVEQAKLNAGGGFGQSVALSADGNTALIGVGGAAWVFTRSNGVWTEQQQLTGAGVTEGAAFGWSVALSADGNTALVGAPYNSGLVGAVWVFTRSNGLWLEQQKLTGYLEDGGGGFGESLALSADGNTALIGGYDDGATGAAWVFTRPSFGSPYTQQEKITGSEGNFNFGISVALSSVDGDTALIGSYNNTSVFTRSGFGSAYTEQQQLGVGGLSLAMSSDGDTALVGDWLENDVAGDARVFTRSGFGSAYTEQQELTGGKEGGEEEGIEFSRGVALSSDGDTALLGAPGNDGDRGAAWAFTRPGFGSAYTEQQELTGGESGDGEFGFSTALSEDGETALVGGLSSHRGAEASAWAFIISSTPPAPTVTKLSSKKGPAAGGTTLTITGTNLTGATEVKFGSAAATSFTVNSATSLTVESPPDTAGTADVTVTTPGGTSPITKKDQFKFENPTVTGVSPNTGTTSGGTSVTVTGTGFAPGVGMTSFTFKKAHGTSVDCSSTTECVVVTPPEKAGTVDVIAAVGKAKSKKSAADHYTYS